MKIDFSLQLAKKMLCFRPHQGIHSPDILNIKSRSDGFAGCSMSITLRQDETISQPTSQELSSTGRLDKIVAVRMEDIHERSVIGGNHKAVVQSLSEMNQAFIGNRS